MKTKSIYTKPNWYKKCEEDSYLNRAHKSDHIGIIALNDIDIKNSKVDDLENWIIENIWDGDTRNNEFLANRLNFLWKLREENPKLYMDMAFEKELIYRYDIKGEIVRLAQSLA